MDEITLRIKLEEGGSTTATYDTVRAARTKETEPVEPPTTRRAGVEDIEKTTAAAFSSIIDLIANLRSTVNRLFASLPVATPAATPLPPAAAAIPLPQPPVAQVLPPQTPVPAYTPTALPLPQPPVAQRVPEAQLVPEPRGSDTIPAMLSPGEFVVNAEAAARHRTLLEDINEGQEGAPAEPFYQKGGSVYMAGGGWPLHFLEQLGGAARAQRLAEEATEQAAQPTIQPWETPAQAAARQRREAAAAARATERAGAMPGAPFARAAGPQVAAAAESAAAAAPVVGVVLAAKEAWEGAMKGMRDSVVGATHAVGQFAVAMANPDSSPAVAFQGVGGAVSAATEKYGKYVDMLTGGIPVFSTLFGVLGDGATTVGQFIRALDGLSQRYGQYSPQIAQAEAFSDIRQVLGDFRRAQQITPAMTRYINARSRLEQQLEDIKVALLERILPALTAVLETTADTAKSSTSSYTILSALYTITIELSKGSFIDFGNIVKQVERLIDTLKDQQMQANSPGEIIMRGYGAPGTLHGGVSVPNR